MRGVIPVDMLHRLSCLLDRYLFRYVDGYCNIIIAIVCEESYEKEKEVVNLMEATEFRGVLSICLAFILIMNNEKMERIELRAVGSHIRY